MSTVSQFMSRMHIIWEELPREISLSRDPKISHLWDMWVLQERWSRLFFLHLRLLRRQLNGSRGWERSALGSCLLSLHRPFLNTNNRKICITIISHSGQPRHGHGAIIPFCHWIDSDSKINLILCFVGLLL